MHFMHSSGFHSLPSRSPTLHQQVSHTSSDFYLSMPASNIHPGATTSAAIAAKPTIRHSGSVPTLQYSTAEYLPNKGQFKTSTHLHNFQKQLNESALKSSRDALATDLEKSKYQIKEFEGRVSNSYSVMLFVCVTIYIWSGEPVGFTAEGEIIRDGGVRWWAVTAKKWDGGN